MRKTGAYTKRVVSKGKEYLYFRPSSKLSRAGARWSPIDSNDDNLVEAATAKAVADLSSRGLFAVKTATRRAYTSAKARAKVKRMPFTITEAEVLQMLHQQDYRCALSGIRFDTQTFGESTRTKPLKPSIDRIDCTLGYVSGNVRIVTVSVNVALSNWGEEALMKMVRGIYERTRTKRKNAKLAD